MYGIAPSLPPSSQCATNMCRCPNTIHAYRGHAGHCFLEHVSGALELPAPDVEVGQAAPQAPHLVGETAQARADDGVHLLRGRGQAHVQRRIEDTGKDEAAIN